METGTKELYFGKVDYNNNGKKDCLVTIEMSLTLKKDKLCFSACGNVWNNIQSDIYMGGQCIDSIWDEFSSQLENKELYLKVMKLWQDNHLNNMNAGTPEQTAAIKQWESKGNKYEYTAVCNHLKSIGLYEVQLNGESYKYGHAWLYRPIPEQDLIQIQEIINN